MKKCRSDVFGMLFQIRLELEERISALSGQCECRADTNLHLFVVRPLGCGLIQDLERVVGFAQPEQRIAEERKDERRFALGDERQLPGADRFLIAAASRVAGSEVEGSREELGVEAKGLAKLRRRRFELAA